ncbi:origin recognition complex subunit 6 [Volvox carteri f. nagariensis]|uniref:Origin recognition complex subunit 6 n=1 Tax=Volvox carteri f. nagariensis TaxID=3068 RepID=D8UI26_VOLCA|nr:origin recognition complex subunit 6 [Volvox carteri f. nagariensis]EFJ40598.1 origin recognition complex subunit 6 [Volvox carteri f. nagariensis]|eukprot:XP_002958305.1 origin recognition complex subunit 6 [Volvox carteri f. nagariensis]
MDIKQLARSLGITQQPAIGRAAELLRLLKLKVPGSLGQGEICRPAVCLELACQTTPGCKLPVREEFIRYSCSAPKVYNEMFTRIQRLLDVRPALDLRELVTLFGCSQLHDSTQQLLRMYKNRVLESLSDAERARADLSRPALLAAAFLHTAKKHRARVDRAALINKMGLTRAELATALGDFISRCGDQMASAASRKRDRNDE